MAERGALVGLYSPTPGCGKTEAAKALALLLARSSRLSFADPMRAMVDALLQEIGASPARARQLLYDRDAKESPAPEFCGRSPRHVLQTLGTEWGRAYVDEHFWTHAAMAKAEQCLTRGYAAIFDDVRFPNEAAAVRAAGGLVVRVFRPGLPPPAAVRHVSDGALDGFEFDLTLMNTAPTYHEWSAYAATTILALIKENGR